MTARCAPRGTISSAREDFIAVRLSHSIHILGWQLRLSVINLPDPLDSTDDALVYLYVVRRARKRCDALPCSLERVQPGHLM